MAGLVLRDETGVMEHGDRDVSREDIIHAAVVAGEQDRRILRDVLPALDLETRAREQHDRPKRHVFGERLTDLRGRLLGEEADDQEQNAERQCDESHHSDI